MTEHTTSERVWDVLTKLSVAASIAMAGMLVSHEVRVSRIEASRFTALEGATMESRILQQRPPEWLKESITEIKTLLRDLDVRLRAVERKVQ